MLRDQLVALVVTLCVTVTCALNFPPIFVPRQRQQDMAPRCPSAAKPCRTRAVMRVGHPPRDIREIQSAACSCQSANCSDDWEAHHDRVITRELLTNGNINMTFSMMFCTPIQPQTRCRSGQVALQLSGLSPIPTEVDFINCSCSERRPLVIHTMTTGADHKYYHAYVCMRYKKKCKRRRRVRDTCMELEMETNTIRYPCRCPFHSSCQPDRSDSSRFVCRR